MYKCQCNYEHRFTTRNAKSLWSSYNGGPAHSNQAESSSYDIHVHELDIGETGKRIKEQCNVLFLRQHKLQIVTCDLKLRRIFLWAFEIYNPDTKCCQHLGKGGGGEQDHAEWNRTIDGQCTCLETISMSHPHSQQPNLRSPDSDLSWTIYKKIPGQKIEKVRVHPHPILSWVSQYLGTILNSNDVYCLWGILFKWNMMIKLT